MSEAQESSRSSRLRLSLRPLSLTVLLGLGALAVSGCLVTRGVVSDQERKLLQQRTEEAGVALGSAITGVQTQLSSIAGVYASTGRDAGAFRQSGTLLTSSPGGYSSLAIVKLGDTPRLVTSVGKPLGTVPAPAVTAIDAAAAKAGATGTIVATPLFDGTSSARRLGWAFVGPSLPGYAVYAESEVRPQTQSPATSSQPFAELFAAVYAVPSVERDQLIVATGPLGDLPLTGKTARTTTPIGQGKPWLLVAKARRPLVGSVATATPWAILAAGLVTALLACGIVETLGRRREYALALVRLRTEELERSMGELAAAHDQLLRQERLAAIGQLASTIGHELRNPLGVLSNALYLLRGDVGPAPNDATKRHLAAAEREVSAATVIVSDLLEFARQRDPVLLDVDLAPLVEEALSVLPPPTGVEVTTDVRPGVTVRADRDQLRQLLLNLVSNAYQAMPEGGRVSVGAVAGDGIVRLWVSDSGEGIADEAKEKLFEPFFTTKARGVGLGLAVCSRVAEAHGGSISVDSTLGEGSTFRVTLPLLVPQREPADETARTEVSP
ncbi:MAG TPA: HAMP domain-containing sensor histidine kinase [Mycobacteriales bacterium]|nr:HAMP domain-containing sensor histidine kinase [Mycobacteriales bacterium]